MSCPPSSRCSWPECSGAERIRTAGVPILNAKVTLLDETGEPVLPVYYSDNYIALLAEEAREIEIQCPAGRPLI